MEGFGVLMAPTMTLDSDGLYGTDPAAVDG